MFKQFSFGLALASILAHCPVPTSAIQFYGDENSAPISTYVQPNEGTPVTFQAKMWGDALLWEHETTSGYTIVQNESTGYWCYAVLNSAGDYAYSDSAIGINNPPAGVGAHLRRSAECLAEIDELSAEIDAANEAAYQAYQLHRDSPHTFRLGILFWEFSNRLGGVDTIHNPPRVYKQGNVDSMFVSEGVFFGHRSDPNLDAHTPWGEEPFGSVRDWYLEMSGGSNDETFIEAGGPFNNGEMLIINEIVNGEIEWLNVGQPDTAWKTWVDDPPEYFNHSYVIGKAFDADLLDDNEDPPFEIIIFIHAGKNYPAGGYS